MAVSNGYISGDIDASDPYVATGAPKFEGGYTAGGGAFRAMVPYINKWAPNKPMGNIFAPLTDPFHVMSQTEKSACYYGLNPPLNGYAQAADIHSYPEWTTWGWTYDLDPMYAKYDPLHTWSGYDQKSVPPCSVKVTSRETFCAEAPVTATFTLPPYSSTGVIPITLLGYPGIFTDRYFCLLCRPLGDSDHWAMITSYKTIGAIYNDGVGGSDTLAIGGAELDALRKKWNAGNKFEWWVCASDARCTTLTEKAAGELNDAGGISFVALPTDNPEKHYGVSEYRYVNYLAQYISVTIWGVSWKNYWSVYDGLYPPLTTMQCGEMLLDYTYGLAMGFTIKNTAPANLAHVQVDTSNLTRVLRCYGNFSGRNVATDVRPFTENAIQANAEMVQVTEPKVNVPLTMAANTGGTLLPGESQHFVIYGDDFLSLPNTFGTVQTGQTIYPTLTAGLGDYVGGVTPEARN